MTLDIKSNGMLKGIEQFKVSTMKVDIIKENGLTIINGINDTNPSSIYSTLELLCSANGRRVCILGDMPGSGTDCTEWHKELGRYASGRDINLIIAVGELARNIYRGSTSNKKSCVDIEYFPTKEQLFKDINGLINNGDTVLVKASPGIGFEKIIDELTRC